MSLVKECAYQRHFEFHEDEQIKHLQVQLAWFLVLVKVFWGGGRGKEPGLEGFFEFFLFASISPFPALLRRLVSTCIKFI